MSCYDAMKHRPKDHYYLKVSSWGLWEQEVGQCVCVAELNDSSRAELQLNEHQAAHSSEQRSSGQVWQVSSEDGWLKIRPICAIRWWHWQVSLALSLTSLSLFFFFFFHFLFVSFWSRDKPSSKYPRPVLIRRKHSNASAARRAFTAGVERSAFSPQFSDTFDSRKQIKRGKVSPWSEEEVGGKEEERNPLTRSCETEISRITIIQ